MRKLYLDIDGVLLTTKGSKPSADSEEFIEFITDNFDCYWLTTHCKGNKNTALKYLGSYFSQPIINKLMQVKETNWDCLKTEAIDFSSNFVWLEDSPMEAEKRVLRENQVLISLIIINLNNPDELKQIQRRLMNIK